MWEVIRSAQKTPAEIEEELEEEAEKGQTTLG